MPFPSSPLRTTTPSCHVESNPGTSLTLTNTLRWEREDGSAIPFSRRSLADPRRRHTPLLRASAMTELLHCRRRRCVSRSKSKTKSPRARAFSLPTLFPTSSLRPLGAQAHMHAHSRDSSEHSEASSLITRLFSFSVISIIPNVVQELRTDTTDNT